MKTLCTVLMLLSLGVVPAIGSPEIEKTKCVIWGDRVPLNNSKVLNWKKRMQEPFTRWAYVKGAFLQWYTPRDFESYRFQIKIGPGAKDTIEISHDPFMGELPELKPGDEILACGTFALDRSLPDNATIGNTAQSYDGYHSDGFLIVNGIFHE